jgi:hypothetical protein
MHTDKKMLVLIRVHLCPSVANNVFGRPTQSYEPAGV